MNIADKKKNNNIAEYVIHMYQTEDLIRAFECDFEKIKKYVIKHIPEVNSNKAEIEKWYENLLAKMKEEDILKEGHLKEVQDIVNQMEVLKDKLLHSDEEFKDKYNNAESDILEMKALSKGLITSDIQICLNGIYGLLLAKINGREVPDDLLVTLDKFGNVLSHLSYKYSQDEYLSSN